MATITIEFDDGTSSEWMNLDDAQADKVGALLETFLGKADFIYI